MENNKSAGIRGDLISVLLGGEVNMGYLIVTMIFCITLVSIAAIWFMFKKK
ncbi:MAG: hypothetical protein PWQ37_631 [Candidatus Petromonas sp.]|jgi:uncharacterized membrane-anchored protein|nr:hypothetical protein [Candidatus Petromonas sp.]